MNDRRLSFDLTLVLPVGRETMQDDLMFISNIMLGEVRAELEEPRRALSELLRLDNFLSDQAEVENPCINFRTHYDLVRGALAQPLLHSFMAEIDYELGS